MNKIDEARRQSIDISKIKREKDYLHANCIVEAQNGIVYSPPGRCTIRTLKALERQGLIEIIQDNSGIGTGFGAFPSKIRVLNY